MTKRKAKKKSVRKLDQIRKQAAIRQLRGKLHWQGDLDAMRTDS